MRLTKPFLKLPIRFDSDALAAEVRALPPSAWTPHPTGYVGNEAVRLVTPNGQPTDNIEGPMTPTKYLQSCDYVREIMAEIGGVWGRSRFMGLGAGGEVPAHIDTNYYWRTHLRIHIPVITNPGVMFTCGDETVHMAAGECWIFDSFRWHEVHNKGSEQRIHLVVDTVGGGLLPELMKAAEAGTSKPRLVRPGERSSEGLVFEKVNSPEVMSPWEMRCHLAFIAEQVDSNPLMAAALERVEQFIDSWAATWARFGTDDDGRSNYSQLLQELRRDLTSLGGEQLLLRNELPLFLVLEQLILQMALAESGQRGKTTNGPRPAADRPFKDRLDRPIFIVSTPRSGSTLLYETLEQAPGLYSIGVESHWLIEDVPGLAPAERGWSSNRLTGADATPERAERLAEAFYRQLRDRDGQPADGAVRMLEKTPKNALRVPFFNAIWPDATFIYLYRDARETLYSMMEAWHSGGFRTYPQLPGWGGPPWSLLLVPGWERLNGMQLPQVIAHQWAITTEQLIGDLEQLDEGRVQAIDYQALLSSPQSEMERLAPAVGLSWDRTLGNTLPLSKTTLSQPKPDKWQRIEPVIQSIWPIVEKADGRAKEFFERRRARTAAAA
ncbi:MAG: sulfotransferase [Sphingomicrobium sp.]